MKLFRQDKLFMSLQSDNKPIISSITGQNTTLARVKMFLMDNPFSAQILLEHGKWTLSDSWIKSLLMDAQMYNNFIKSYQHHMMPVYANQNNNLISRYKGVVDAQYLIKKAEVLFDNETLSSRYSMQKELDKMEVLLTMVTRKDNTSAWEWIKNNHIKINAENWFSLCIAFPKKGQNLLPEIYTYQNNSCYLRENLFLFDSLCEKVIKSATEKKNLYSHYHESLKNLQNIYSKLALYENLSQASDNLKNIDYNADIKRTIKL